jgi:hypothetical protein
MYDIMKQYEIIRYLAFLALFSAFIMLHNVMESVDQGTWLNLSGSQVIASNQLQEISV